MADFERSPVVMTTHNPPQPTLDPMADRAAATEVAIKRVPHRGQRQALDKSAYPGTHHYLTTPASAGHHQKELPMKIASPVLQRLGWLGLRVEDRVTGFSGVVASVSFDLYGCVQAFVNPGKDKDGKLSDGYWFDVSRLIATSSDRVMPAPSFDGSPETIAAGLKGPAEKPAYCKP